MSPLVKTISQQSDRKPSAMSLGAAVEIVKRQLDPAGEGTGIYLLGNAVRALDTLGSGVSGVPDSDQQWK